MEGKVEVWFKGGFHNFSDCRQRHLIKPGFFASTVLKFLVPGGNKEPFCSRWASWSSWCSWSHSTGSTVPSTSMVPACSHNLGETARTSLFTTQFLIWNSKTTHKSVPLGNSQPTICLRSVSQYHESCCGFSFLITRHLHQVLIVSSTACMCNTSWTAFWLRYRPPDYDGTFTFRHNPVSKSNIKVQSFVHQRISKKLQYIGATIFMAISLGVLSLSYWAQVSNKFLHI